MYMYVFSEKRSALAIKVDQVQDGEKELLQEISSIFPNKDQYTGTKHADYVTQYKKALDVERIKRLPLVEKVSVF